MSTIKVTNIQHPDAAEPAITLSSTGDITFSEPPVENLNDVVDVDINAPASGDALVFDGEEWVNDSTTYQNLSEKNAANGYAGLDGAGKLNANTIPALAITETFVVANQAGRLALSAQIGDIAIQSDESKTFILEGSDPSNNEDWVQILTPEPSVPSELDDLTNVNASEPSSGNFLKFTGETWNPSTPNLNDLGNVYASQPSAGDYIKYQDAVEGVKATLSFFQGDTFPYMTLEAKEFGNVQSFVFLNVSSELNDISHIGGTGDWQINIPAQTPLNNVREYINDENKPFEFVATVEQNADAVTESRSLSGGVNPVAGGWYNTQLSTDNISEGSSNLYYTDQRVDGRISLANIDDISDVNVSSPSENDYLKYQSAVEGVKALGIIEQDDLVLRAKEAGTAANGIYVIVSAFSGNPGISVTESEPGSWSIQAEQGEYLWSEIATFINQQTQLPFESISGSTFDASEGATTLSGGVDPASAGWYSSAAELGDISDIDVASPSENDSLQYVGIPAKKATATFFLGFEEPYMVLEADQAGDIFMGQVWMDVDDAYNEISHYGGTGDWVIRVPFGNNITSVAAYINQQSDFNFSATAESMDIPGSEIVYFSGGVNAVAPGWRAAPAPVIQHGRAYFPDQNSMESDETGRIEFPVEFGEVPTVTMTFQIPEDGGHEVGTIAVHDVTTSDVHFIFAGAGWPFYVNWIAVAG